MWLGRRLLVGWLCGFVPEGCLGMVVATGLVLVGPVPGGNSSLYLGRGQGSGVGVCLGPRVLFVDLSIKLG